MFILRLTHKDSTRYNIINKRSQIIAGHLTYSHITKEWYMDNEETKSLKIFANLPEAVAEITQ